MAAQAPAPHPPAAGIRVELCDESRGVLGQLLDPAAAVLEGMRRTATQQQQDDNSNDDGAILVQWDNATRFPLTVRGLDGRGRGRDATTVDPFSSAVQPARPGQLFVLWLSVTTAATKEKELKEEEEALHAADDDNLVVVGAYRTLRALPSGAPHTILLLQPAERDGAGTTTEQQALLESSSCNNNTCGAHQQQQQQPHPQQPFFLEHLLIDDQDALLVAGALLDPVAHTGSGGTQTTDSNSTATATSLHQTLATLSQVVDHLLEQPRSSAKFRTLRLSNPRVRRDLLASPGACHLLQRVLQFGSTPSILSVDGDNNENNDNHRDDRWTVSEQFAINHRDLLQRTAQLLRQLQSRLGVAAELAPRAPWQPSPVVATTTGAARSTGGLRGNNNEEGTTTHFVSAEERWARAERAAARRRRGGGSRPFRPGRAPSSRGPWGR